jgi:hypothetical protein
MVEERDEIIVIDDELDVDAFISYVSDSVIYAQQASNQSNRDEDDR